MKRVLSVLSVSTALFLAGVLSYAQGQDTENQGRHPRHGKGRPEIQEKMKERHAAFKAELGLTEAQETDLKKAHESAREERHRISTGLRASRAELRTLLEAEKVDEAAVNAKVAEVQAGESALVKLRVDSILSAKRILTPEQQKKLAEARDGRKEKRAEFRKNHPRVGERLRERKHRREGAPKGSGAL